MQHIKEFDFTLFKNTMNFNRKSRAKKVYIQDIFTFDTETTSLFRFKDGRTIPFDKTKDKTFYKQLEKVGICYIWSFSWNEKVFYGRYLHEFKIFIDKIYKIIEDKFLYIWVHNLSYDFQFLLNVLKFENVFARETHKVMKCQVENTNIIFRDSYILTNMSLDSLSKNFNLPTKKLVGIYDYTLMRHNETKLINREFDYIEHDNLALYEYMKIELKRYIKMEKIPLTATSKVRLDFQQHLKDVEKIPERKKYSIMNWKRKVAFLTPELDQFKKLVKCFSGGYTHANSYHSCKVFKLVNSYDFTSSYPYVMLTEKYPCEPFAECKPDLDKMDFENKAYILKVEFTNLTCISNNTYISFSKCDEIKGFKLDNGRVDSAKHLIITCTEQDYITITNNYTSEQVKIISSMNARKKYLPYEFTSYVLELFNDKTQLKGVDGQEEMYSFKKACVNSCYGMCVTNTIKDEVELLSNGEWIKHELSDNDISELLDEQAFKNKNLLPYSWGVWITAYARRNLWSIIEKIDSDVIYCDTDSIKFINDHIDIIKEYNKEVTAKINRVCQITKLDASKFHDLGQFDHDGLYSEFKTLGAKKYAFRYEKEYAAKKNKDTNLHITVSGVSKKGATALNEDINNFKEKFVFNYDNSYKQELYYNNEQKYVTFKDYKGKELTVHQNHGICLKPTTYQLGITDDYRNHIISKQLFR